MEEGGRLLTKTALPVRAVAVSPDGGTVAVAGDEAGVRLLDAGSLRALRTLGSDAYTRGLAYDPEGEYVAALAASGTLTIYGAESGKVVLARKAIGPKARDTPPPAWMCVSWRGEGGLFGERAEVFGRGEGGGFGRGKGRGVWSGKWRGVGKEKGRGVGKGKWGDQGWEAEWESGEDAGQRPDSQTHRVAGIAAKPRHA